MSKEEQRRALAAMLLASNVPITKVAPVAMDDSLSASFIAKGIDKKRQAIKKEKQATRKQRVKRNWAAQRRYDEQHGTVNGYDPYIEEMMAIRRHETGE